MNPNEIQFERYWRKKISQEIALYELFNMNNLSEETSEVLEHLRKNVRTVRH